MTTRLWIDGQCLQTDSRLRGIGRYLEELLRTLSKRPDIRLNMSFNAAMADEALAARERVASFIPAADIHMWESPRNGGEALFGHSDKRRLGAIALAHHVACLAPDIALSASPFEGFMDEAVPLEPGVLPGCPVASIFYDAIPYRFPDRYLTSTGLRAAYDRRLSLLGHYDLNLCISAFSAQEATEIAGSGVNIDISAGASRDLLALRDTAPVPTSAEPYVLYVGGLDWRKNVEAIVEAFALLAPALRATTRFVFVGPHHAGLLAGLRVRWTRLGLAPDNLVIRTEISDLELASLYRGAKLLANASYMEGFGLPALEAMSFGIPVIVARRGAAIEVVQDPELMFEPDDHDELAKLMTRILTDRAFAADKAQEGQQRAAAFTWERTAEKAAAALIGTVQAYVTKRSGRVRPSPDERRQTAMATIQQDCPSADHLAEVMARAEPETPSAGRLFVDATSTIQSDGGTGIQRVTRNISRYLADREAIVMFGDRETPLSPAWWEAGRLRAPLPGTPAVHFRSTDVALMLDSSWEFHDTYRKQLRAARLRGAEVVSVVYDFVPAMTPAFCDSNLPPVYMAWLRSALTYSSGFVCISQAVAMELHTILQAIRFPHPMKIGWWPLGADFQNEAAPLAAATARQSQRPHFLMVGTIEPRKGYDVALAAFELLWADGFDAELSIIGKPGWLTEGLVARMTEHPEAGRRLHVRGGVSDAEVAEAYAMADALVSASHAEGFGLPLVEARHFGKPAIVSDLPVFREVTSGAGNVLFFEPGKAAALAQAIRQFAAQPKTGVQPAEPWPNWEESAQRLREIVFNGGWQMEYRPDKSVSMEAGDEIGDAQMKAMLDPREAVCELEAMLVEPLPGRGVRLRIRISNRSSHVWSSNLANGGRNGFRLVGEPRDEAGRSLGKASQATIPFVLAPNQQAIIAMQFDRLPGGTRDILVQAGQDGGPPWSGELRIAIDE